VFEKNGTYRYQFGVPGKEEGQLWYPRKVNNIIFFIMHTRSFFADPNPAF
jgi:hypothetical protein